ncbi:hypothetical protein [Geomesophilobacter sediminis]|uniref:Lipoprotein n=1 Tax=Geomesophilobacter sediminis TaxID=2798584 RepID=A0A8J7LUY6_9BACT|nr:hypothetical protein [Geomesophilobacter sediminis]MBJ6725189.1 hypothetical protein [Geomesophilobacter sediminis]
MKLVVVILAVLIAAGLSGCGSTGSTESSTKAVSNATSNPAGTQLPTAAKIQFSLNSNAVAASEINALRFKFTLPAGLEPVLTSTTAPSGTVQQIDPAQISESPLCTGAFAVASYDAATRQVEVALIDSGFTTLGSIFGSITFPLANAGTAPLSTLAVTDLQLEEALSNSAGTLKTSYLTLTSSIVAAN